METKYNFTKMNIVEFDQLIKSLRVARTILRIQQHHTYSPSYIHFKDNNHFDLQRAMKNYHVTQNGWNDIGQHFTIFPDGTILTGIEKSPACITGQNANSICIENFGNFDKNGDIMNQVQKEAIVAVTAILCAKFNILAESNSVVYHHWFDLSTGYRNNGTRNNKSCPGTNFFGGNTVKACESNFLPLVKAKLLNIAIKKDTSNIVKYVCVNTKTLNIRTQPDSTSLIASDRGPVTLGAVLRVYQEQDGWFKISNNQQYWVASKSTFPVQRAFVNSDTLNVRSGSDLSFPKTGSYKKGDEVFIVEVEKNWCKVSMEDKWVNKKYLDFKQN